MCTDHILNSLREEWLAVVRCQYAAFDAVMRLDLTKELQLPTLQSPGCMIVDKL